jgi:hypothetical protein
VSSIIDSSSNWKDEDEKCPSQKSPNGKHEYVTTCGNYPSEERTCKYCGDKYYTK